MSSPKFSDLIREFPDERGAIAKLESLVQSRQPRELTLDHLILTTAPQSVDNLARILERLTRSGVFRRVWRVESDATKGAIDDFATVDAIPERIHDWHTDTDIAVTPRNLQVIYSVA